MSVQTVKISEVKSNPNNPRLIKNDKFEKLVKSLKDFPEMAKVRPIVVNQDFVVLGGNMRLKAMKEAGWKEVPIEVVDWTEQQQKEFIIKDNVGFGEWEWDMLANEWEAEDLEKWGLDVPKFEEQADPFDDAGVEGKNQYGVIVMCASEGEQEHIFIRLTGEGFNCKIVVT
jgi:ParB-like chromosome segregation protein Spo0J